MVGEVQGVLAQLYGANVTAKLEAIAAMYPPDRQPMEFLKQCQQDAATMLGESVARNMFAPLSEKFALYGHPTHFCKTSNKALILRDIKKDIWLRMDVIMPVKAWVHGGKDPISMKNKPSRDPFVEAWSVSHLSPVKDMMLTHYK